MSSIADCKQPSVGRLFGDTAEGTSGEGTLGGGLTEAVGRPQTDLTNLLLEQLQTPIEEMESVNSDQYDPHDHGRYYTIRSGH